MAIYYYTNQAMDNNGFYVTLPCNASLTVYPENRISSYKTNLSKTIHLKGDWEVALAEIEYPRSWYNITDDDGIFNLNMYPDHDNEEKKKKLVANVQSDLHGFYVSRRYQIPGGYYKDIPAVIKMINDAIKPSGILFYDELKNKINLVAKPNIFIGFYEKLGAILGVRPEEGLGQTAYHEKADFTRTVSTYAPHQADIKGGFYTLYVYTDIIDYQSVGDSYVPLLRCVHITGENNDIVSVRYDKPHYASVNKSIITDINVEIKDDQNREVRFAYGKVIVKLHFRPVKQTSL